MRRFLTVLCPALILAQEALADRAAAESLVAEARKRLEARDFAGAEQAYSKAIEADPGWAEAWGRRGQARRMDARPHAALQDFAMAIDLDPEDGEWRVQRVQAYLSLDRVPEALEDAEALQKIDPNPGYLTALGAAQLRSGQIDKGLETQGLAIEQAQGHPLLRVRAEGFILKGDWDAAIREIDEREAGGVKEPSHWYFRAIALVEKGDFEGAAKAAEQARAASRGTIGYMTSAYLASTPTAGKFANPDQALADIEKVAKDHPDSIVMHGWARALWLNGRERACLDLLSTKGRRSSFGTLFWLGAAYWKLGQFAEARAVLRDAWRLNPYIGKHAEKYGGFAEFVATVERDMAAEKADTAGGAKLGYELATHLLTVAEIETLVRRYRFDDAVKAYEGLRQGLASAVRRAEIETRLPEVRAMAAAHARILAAVKAAPGKLKSKAGTAELTIQSADASAFDFTIKGGSGRYPWAYLGIEAYCELASGGAVPAEELLGLGCLALESGAEALSVKLLEAALKKDPALKERVGAAISRRAGVPAPPGGFLSWRGAWVTPDEKKNLEKGLVRWQGGWVASKDRDQLAKGMIQAGGKWVAGDEAALTRLGYRKYKGRWLGEEDYVALRRQWAEAWTEETEHWQVRTNEGEAFARDLAGLLEASYGAMKAYFGDTPKGPARRLQAFAFRDYEDYRACCLDSQAESHLNAAGFARRDAGLAAGWNKTANRRQFLQTMVHEAAHLYYTLSFPDARPPSFHAEGLAAWFEGCEWDGARWTFPGISESRIPFVRDAVRGRRHIPLAELLTLDGLDLIQRDSPRTLLFYAEAWALHDFLSRTEVAAWRDGYTAWRAAVARGSADPLTTFVPDVEAFEKAWLRHVEGL